MPNEVRFDRNELTLGTGFKNDKLIFSKTFDFDLKHNPTRYGVEHTINHQGPFRSRVQTGVSVNNSSPGVFFRWLIGLK